MLASLKNDAKFNSSLINVNVLETLYRDFFKQSIGGNGHG